MSRAGGRYDATYDERDYYRSGGASRSRYNDVDVDVRTRERDDYDRRARQPEFLREDYGRSNAGPVVLARDGERRKPNKDYEEEEILVRTKSRDPPRNAAPSTRYREEDYVDIRESETRSRGGRREREEIDLRESETRSRGGGRRDREEVDVDIREKDARSRTSRRDHEHEHDDIDVKIRSSSRPAPKRTNTEDIVFRRGEGDRRRPTESVVDKEEIRINRDEYPPYRRRESSNERIDIKIRERSRDRAPPPARSRSNYDRDEIDIRIREDEGRRRRDDVNENTLVVRERSHSRPRRIASEREDYYFRKQSPSPPPRPQQDEIIIRRKHRSPSRSPSPVQAPSPPTPEPVPDLPPIMRPPIHQEIITHHRHIDHGVRRAPSSKSSSPSPPPKRRERNEDLDIEIRRRDGRNVEDIHIRDRGDDEPRSHKAPTRASSSSAEKVETRANHHSRSRAGSRMRSRSRAQKDRERENFELSLEINNNVNNERRMVPAPPQPPAPPSRPKEMWTEITKDLVSREAIEYMGYPYEETADFFYVMEYMRYDDVTRLVELSEELHRDRKQRIEQIQWERQDPRLPEPREERRAIEGPRDRDRRDYDERIYEREVIYEDGTRRRYRI